MSNTKHTPGPWRMGVNDNDEKAWQIMPERWKGQDNLLGYALIAQVSKWSGEPLDLIRESAVANAKLIAAAPELLEGGSAQTEIIESAQRILTLHLLPDGIGATECISRFLELLDGHRQRDAKAKWDSAFSKATN